MSVISKIVSYWFVGATAVFGGVAGCSAQDGAPDEDTTVEEPPPMSEGETPIPPACSAEADCGGGLACVAETCQACAGHGDCESDVCDLDAATGQGLGACVAEARVVYVADDYPACATGDGTRTAPLCAIRDALPLAVGDRDTIRVYAGWYLPFGISGRTLRVFGPRDGSAEVGEEDIGAAVRITNGAQAVLDGLELGVSVRNGVNCMGSRLRVVRGSARGDSSGIVSSDCDLELDRMVVAGLTRSGITISGTGSYAITNSYFRGGDIQAVVFSGTSTATGRFQFNTVRGGGEIAPGGIDCGTTPRAIEDSIVVGSFGAAGGAQTVGACTHARVVVGSFDSRPDPGLIRLDPDLDAEGRLLDTAANEACCVDQSGAGPARDFFGTARPLGVGYDLGAHELK